MPARSLKHYRYAVATAAAWETAVAAIPANRSLVVSKLVISRVGAASSVAVSISIGATSGSPGNIINNQPLGMGESYTESGLVLVAGEILFGYCDVANAILINVFGEEVDN